jgi:hypothetical protein
MSDHELTNPPPPGPSSPPIQPPPPIPNQPYGQPGVPPPLSQPYAQPSGYALPNQPYGQPGPFPQPGPLEAPPKKKRKIWPWVVLVAVLLPLLLIGGCVAWFYSSVKGPIDTSNEFLARVDDGNFDQAFELIDRDCFADGSLPEIETFFTEQDLTSYDLSGTSIEGNSGTATGTITLDNASSRDVQFDLIKDDGWKICGIDIDE